MTVMKPVKGRDEDTFENLRSFLVQDYPAYQVVFGLADEDDPAREVVEKLIAGNPDRDASLVISGSMWGENQKISNLLNMYPLAKYDIIVISDSDMRVEADYLARVADGFRDESVGLVTCPYRGARPGDIGSAFEALTINSDFLPSVTVAERLEGISFALGATMAVRREALERIGGLKSLVEYLADDYQLGNRVKKAGYGLRLVPCLVDSVQGRESFSGYFMHQLRWGRTYRACRPVSYFFSVLTKGTAFSLLFLAVSGFGAIGWSVFLIDLALRFSQALYMESMLIKAPGTLRYYWLLPVKDVLGFVLWALSFTGRTVSWKGTRFRVDSEGRMKRAG
jgi:ceramide glucosyltransferase